MSVQTTATGDAGAGIIDRKLAPPAAGRCIPRVLLDERIAELLEAHQVLVVAATAGAGKTTAVSAATERIGVARAWLSVDRTDTAPGRLVTYLEAAFARTVPRLHGIASRALAAGLAHPEAAGLLVQSLDDTPVIVVLDDLERLGTTPASWAVVEALIRYAAPTTRFVLVSRRDIPSAHCALPSPPATAWLGSGDLAFTVGEATEALELVRGEPASPAAVEQVVRATGGWVTGVLFAETDATDGFPAGATPMADYISVHVLAQLEDEDREFLVRTALLDEVDADAAAAFGIRSPGACLRRLRSAHLPVSWTGAGSTMRAHPLLREHLLDLLSLRDPADVGALRIAHAELLAERGHDEEAVEELLRAEVPELAVTPAERSIRRVVERADFAIADRWLARLRPFVPPDSFGIGLAEILMAIARGHFRRAAAVGDRLHEAGERDRIVAHSDTAAALIAWAYMEACRYEDAARVLGVAGDGPCAEAARYAERLMTPGASHETPRLTGGPTDALVLGIDHGLGRFEDLTIPPATDWLSAVAAPWRIAALRATGRTQEALTLFAEARRTETGEAHKASAFIYADLLVDAGQREEALAVLEDGRTFMAEHGCRWRWIMAWCSEARARLRLDRDGVGARAALARVAPALEEQPLMHQQGAVDTWAGFAALLLDEPEEAVARLRPAVDSMLDAGRMSDLPHAAVYLAEAEWRLGHEDGADRAADLALASSRRIGSNHLMLQALADFPAVASRRIDAEREADTAWHEIGRALIVRGTPLDTTVGVDLDLADLGAPRLTIDGAERRPRIAKTYELIAFLAKQPNREASRDVLLDALFDGRNDDSARAYLRQAVNQLSRLLPDPSALTSTATSVRLGPEVRLATASGRLRSDLKEASRMGGEGGLRATLRALDGASAGEFLSGAQTAWVDAERRALGAEVSAARHAAATQAFEQEHYLEALDLTIDALDRDPVREDTWRLLMRIKSVLGDDVGVLTAYRDCCAALEALGIRPAQRTRETFELLRR